MRVYHVVTGLDSHFKTLEDAQGFLQQQSFSPMIPESYTSGEDRTIPRLCVAQSVEDCITGIGVRRVFFRCLEAWDAPSYISEGQEQYPIGILEIEVPDSEICVPLAQHVPDVDFTHELWIKSDDFEILDRHIVWLDQYSIDIDDQEENPNNVLVDEARHVFEYRCLAVRYSESPYPDKHHPWIDDRGSILMSRESEPYYEVSEECSQTHMFDNL